ncbi:transmembrane channel-like protein 6 isoform X2 [Danio rerio]|nr:transmembrane channel-like protein 6 [Danio rerio]|eukprot:XP_017210326.1 transmembrane channel-like protein 6 [Danio rerio]
MAASRIMETIPGEDGDLFELEAVWRPNREVRFDLTHANEDIEAHYNEPKHRHTLQRSSWSSSTQKVLSSMPSRSMKWNQAAAVNQSRSTKTQQRRPLSICTEDQDVFTDQDDYVDDELLKKLQGLSVGESAQLLREMPLSVSEKRQMRELVVCWESGKPRSANRPLCLYWFQTCLKKVVHSDWSGRQKSLQLWQKVFKNISAHFGMGVLSYFVFLRRLLLFNLLLMLINGLFLLLPQLSNPSSSTRTSSEAEHKSNLWMLTGMGILTDSVMFYGHYSDCQNGSSECFENYNIPLAYIFTFGTGMFVTCVKLVYNMSKAFGKSQSSTNTRSLVFKVFCSWDFKVYKKRSVRLQSVNICTQLKEMLSELSCKKQKRNLCSMLRWLSLHLLVWSICLLCMGACIFAVNYFHLVRPINSHDAEPVYLLILPLAVSAYSRLLPVLFDMLSRVEQYNSPDIRIYVSIARNLLLKGCIFTALCLWFGEIKPKKNEQCWETMVGQELYRLIVMDLIFEVLYIILAQFFWGFCVRNVTLRRRKLEFAIAQEVLELIYSQTLVWFGVLFSPLLPAVQIGKLYVLFYLKKTSLMVNFHAPKKHWRASQMSNLFIKLLFIPSFTGALTCVIYVMWSVKPSSGCGPFRNFDSMLLIIDQAKNSHSLNWLNSAYIHWVYNPLFLFLISGAFLAIIYIHMQVVDGQKVITGRLQKQINFEGEDKKFLIDKIQALNELKSQQ